MSQIQRFDPARHTVSLTRQLSASITSVQQDPPPPVDGVSIGVAVMHESAPHGGEMHPDGDEVLYLISGLVKVHMDTDDPETILVKAGDGVVVPQGTWHRVEVIEPCQIVYVTPGPNSEYRALREQS